MPEIERKFLVDELPPEVRAQPVMHLRQGYLSVEPTEVRLRSIDGRTHELTIKSQGGLERAEVNLALEPEQFEELWPLVETSVEKTRTRVEVAGWIAEVDVYEGRLRGLMVVEVEFPSEAEATAFIPPAWFVSEVTEDPRYRNAALAGADSPP